jgi:hypothetical protein
MAKRVNTGKARRLRPWLRRLGCAALALSVVTGASCTRTFFRKAADREVEGILTEKDKYPAWHLEQYHVYPDPRARFADPTNPDRPPMPPDDPAAHKLSPNPQRPGKAGTGWVEGDGYLELMREWDAQNRAEAAADSDQNATGDKTGSEPAEKLTVPPQPEAAPGAGDTPREAAPSEKPDSGKTESGEAPASSTTSLSTKGKPGAPRPFLLKLEQSVELGLINSREYQDRREDLYLTALPVTLERFAFAPQFFAVGQAIRQWAGRQTPEGPLNNWTLNSNVGVTKLFSTGALLLLSFANQTVFNFAGFGRPVTSVSNINLDLVQPLLRGGGQAVTLEPLTQAERNLLYEIRDFARFREEFYVAIAGGGGGSITGANFQPTGVIAPTPFAPGAGIGTSGLVPGTIATPSVTGERGLQVGPGPSGRVPLTTAFAAPVSGYLTTLLNAAQMRVDEYNIAKLQGFLKLARAMQEGGDISQLQTDQFEQQVLQGRTFLLRNQQQYLNSLDQFKLQLGVPTNLSIELEDTAFRPLNQQFQRYENLFRQFEAAGADIGRFSTPEQAARVRGEIRRVFTSAAIVQGTRFRSGIQADWAAWEKLSTDDLQKRLAGYRAELRRLRDLQTDLETKGQALSAADQERLNKVEAEIALGQFESVLREYEGQPWKNVADASLQRRRQQGLFHYVVDASILVLAEARNERVVLLRSQWPELARLCVNQVDLLKVDLDEAQTAVIQAALTNRFDLMNARAQVVDAWRQIAVFANALLGTFNVNYHLDSATPAGLAEPLAFAASRTRHQLFLNTELPLVRMAERNNYRAALINYQRWRRILQRAEDQVMFDTRGEIRLLRQQEENYRIQQRQVELAYMTVENSLDTFQQPPAPVPAGQGGGDTQTRAAALTTQLIQAQTNLYNAQIALTTTWITYLNTRLQLYRDMELMPLDFRGVWIDDVATCECPDGRDRQSGAGPGKSAGERDDPGGAGGSERAQPQWLPEPASRPRIQGPWLDDSR